jgi:hypothetical protein
MMIFGNCLKRKTKILAGESTRSLPREKWTKEKEEKGEKNKNEL